MNMGARIKGLLTERGWKQADLLERVPEMDAGALSAIIKRDSRFSEYALGISRAFGVSLDFLIFGIEERPASAAAPAVEAGGGSLLNAEEVCELLTLYGACDEAGRSFIRDAARARAMHTATAVDQRKRRS